MTFGEWTKLYRNIKHRDNQRAIANHFKTSPKYLASWIRSLLVLRNCCAHHARIWNAELPYKPDLPPKLEKMVGIRNKLADRVMVLRELLIPLGLRDEFISELRNLLAEYPGIPIEPMGFKTKTEVEGTK